MLQGRLFRRGCYWLFLNRSHILTYLYRGFRGQRQCRVGDGDQESGRELGGLGGRLHLHPHRRSRSVESFHMHFGGRMPAHSKWCGAKPSGTNTYNQTLGFDLTPITFGPDTIRFQFVAPEPGRCAAARCRSCGLGGIQIRARQKITRLASWGNPDFPHRNGFESVCPARELPAPKPKL